MITKNIVNYDKKVDILLHHSFVTGGSQGLGLSTAIELIKRGSNVTICARNKSKLSKAVDELTKYKVYDDQYIGYTIADLSDYSQTISALNKAKGDSGETPSMIFCCAGCSTPGWFAEMSVDNFMKDMQTNYYSALWTVKAATSIIIQDGIKDSHVTLVSSVLGFPLGLPGYSSYTPSKHAIRGLGDTLRTELQLYDIRTHVYFPGTIYTPGYETENETKPALTKKIEGAADGLTPQECAIALLKGIDKDEYQITSDFVGSLIKNISRGASPTNNILIDTFYLLIAAIAFPFWRIYMDYLVKSEKKVKNH
ncbi:oxidoreductase [Wallemia mellicola]|nr:oxidoreductase [Wallemia mellicola]TIC45124.1 oxidoreductase [Wallemia mellicola]